MSTGTDYGLLQTLDTISTRDKNLHKDVQLDLPRILAYGTVNIKLSIFAFEV